MEVRINREIRDYTESMFFGLSLRQFFFSVLACGIAVGIYLGLNPILGTETTSWLCIVAAFPFAVLGFLKYNGMECCECGCCSYICPAKRQLTQSIKTMRKLILANKKKK